MYFANKEHEENYHYLMDLYHLNQNEDVEYESNIYIAAYPEIFKCFDREKLSTEFGPLVFLFHAEDGEEHHPERLTGSTKALAKIGMSLYNNSDVQLGYALDLLDDEMYQVFLQALAIRTKRQ